LLTFLKKTRFSSKNERASCMPGPKNGERPYLAVPEATFWGLFLDLISPDFVPLCCRISKIIHTTIQFSFYLYSPNVNAISQTPGMVYPTNNYHSHFQSINTATMNRWLLELKRWMTGIWMWVE